MPKKKVLKEKTEDKNKKIYKNKRDKYIKFLVNAFDSAEIIHNKTLAFFKLIKKNRFNNKKKILLMNELNELRTKEIENITIFENYVYKENYKENKKSNKWKKDPWNDDKWLNILEKESI